MNITERAIKEYDDKIERERIQKEKEFNFFSANVSDRFKQYTGAEKFEIETKEYPIKITCDGLNFEVNQLMEFFVLKTCERCGNTSKYKFISLSTLGGILKNDSCGHCMLLNSNR